MKNFIYLIIITAFIGLFLKFYFKSEVYIEKKDLKIDINEEVVDSIFYDDLNSSKSFTEYLGYNYNKLELIFDISPFDNIDSKYYAYGNLYFKRYFEFIAAKDLLCEINNNLFNNPIMNRYVMLPLVNSLGNNKSINILFENYIPLAQKMYGTNNMLDLKQTKEPDELFSDSFSIDASYCSNSNKDCVDNSDCNNGETCIYREFYEIYNPSFYEYHASDYLEKSIENFSQFLYNSNNKNRILSSAVKLSLLFSKSNNIVQLESTFNKYLDLNILVQTLNNFDNEPTLVSMLDIEIIDLIVDLEKNNIINKTDVLSLVSNIKNSELNKLYLLQRELNNLDKVKELPSYSCTNIEDIMFAPEIMLALSEINYRNNNFTIAENIMYDFWSNCSTGMYPRLDWIYNNYPSQLLRSFRLSMWHGSLIPQMNKFFRQQYIDELFIDDKFENLNMAIKLWINATISFGLDDSVGK